MACKATTRISTAAGFSLPELIVTIAIITLVSGAILLRFSAFNSTTLLKSQAYEVAFDLRETQVFGLSVRSTGAPSNQFREEYGMYFDMATPREYLVFQDSGSAEPAWYDSDDGDVLLNTINLDSRYEITELCPNSPGCSSDAAFDEVSITFQRPNFDAAFNGTGSTVGDSSISSVYITMAPINDNSSTRTVLITRTGQISVQPL